ncbi:MAG: flagellar hook-basal body protein [Actinomycetota bacterium]|nr:flagellar hook-basal body protein [Actinomycetota bacterium]
MIRGLYASALGMLAQMNKNDVIANNLANVNTNGYKRDAASVVSFSLAPIKSVEGSAPSAQTPSVGYLGMGVGLGKTVFDPTQGALRQTGGELDFAISGEAFFTVQTPSGNMYTRNGSFSLDSTGQLVDGNGYLVLGQDGPIKIEGSEVVADLLGNIYVDGVKKDTFKIVAVEKAEGEGQAKALKTQDVFKKEGNGLFSAASEPAAATGFQVVQGTVETSNVDLAREMTEMIATFRAYEANQQAISSHNETLGKAVNEVGRLR